MKNTLPALPPKKLKLGDTPDITGFIEALNKQGVELTVNIHHTKDNEVEVSIRCRKSPRDVKIINRTLFSFFGK